MLINQRLSLKKHFSLGTTNWLKRHIKDEYVKKSKFLDYRSRAAFKLIEINEKFKILKPNQTILDFGASPGGWSQVVSSILKQTSGNPRIIAVDMLDMDPIEGVVFIKGDILSSKVQKEVFKSSDFNKFDVILSDACPEFIGIKETDLSRSSDLNRIIVKYGFKYLKKDGHMVIKSFEGKYNDRLVEILKTHFRNVYKYKPLSSRSESSEIYVVSLYMNLKIEKLVEGKEDLEIKSNEERNKELSQVKDKIEKDKFKKYIQNKSQVNEGNKGNERSEDKLHVDQMIKDKLEELDFNLLQKNEIVKAIEEENLLSLRREDDFEENKTLIKYKTWKEESINENDRLIENMDTNVLDSSRVDDYEKQFNQKFEKDVKRNDKIKYNSKSKKEKEKEKKKV